MSDNGTAVTNDRFEQGLTYGAYVDQINVNRDRFEQCKSSASEVMGDDDAEFFKAAVANGLSKVLVLGEDWCPDVYRGMPVIATISEVSGMEMRVFPRDLHLDIMDEFLKDGQHRSIPVAVFYTDDLSYVCHWIERPSSATEEMKEIDEALANELSGQDEQVLRDVRRQRINARFSDWQHDTIKEIRQLLKQTMNG